MRRPAFFLVLHGGLTLLLATWLAVLLWPARTTPPLSFEPLSFSRLSGWQDDNQSAALAAFLKSCEVFSRQPPSKPAPPPGLGGTVGDWLPVCDLAGGVAPGDQLLARRFFEEQFTPFAVLADDESRGLFTGYYEPIIEGSLTVDPDYPVPLYGRPGDLVTVDLGQFRAKLKGTHVAGRVNAGRLMPFESRAQIEAGALDGRGLELLWLRDPVDAFNLHIQGSGRIRLADGSQRRVGYAGPNGHPYTSLGKLLIKRGLMTAEDLSAPALWRWVRANPVEGAALMQENASFVFFRLLDDVVGIDDGPVGASGVPLTPGRSLAIDRSLLPLGAPYWLDASQPDPADPTGEPLLLARLLVAQDVGGAIKGAVRGDVFWGKGEEAEIIAGHMANYGRIFVLLPKSFVTNPAKTGQTENTDQDG